MPATTVARRRPSGRRTGDSGTRAEILRAATALFAERGYDATSIRAIAADAGVDPALIRHFFGDKDALYTTVLADRNQVFQRLAAALPGDRVSLGRRVTDTYLRLWDDPDIRPVLLALVRSATTSERAAAMLRDLMERRVAATDDSQPVLRGERLALAASQLLGLALGRHVLKVPSLVAMSHDELVDEVAPSIQRYLIDDRVPVGPEPRRRE